LHFGFHARGVEDAVEVVDFVLYEAGETVLILGGGTDLTNHELTDRILAELGLGWDRVRNIPDRRSNDRRYAMDWSKVAALGYQPTRAFERALADTVRWYRDNPSRWAPLPRDPSAPIAAITLDAAGGQ
jgi:dTDP-glucose 4,6-dehydratase